MSSRIMVRRAPETASPSGAISSLTSVDPRRAPSGGDLATSLQNPDGRLLRPWPTPTLPAPQPGATGVLVFADGRVVWGRGFGAEGEAVGEVCFNTAMTGYQEIMTDPSYAKQIITFTFPHIGNVGANDEDLEADDAHALGCVVREDVTAPSNFRAQPGLRRLDEANGRIGLAGVDTRALTRRSGSSGRRTG